MNVLRFFKVPVFLRDVLKDVVVADAAIFLGSAVLCWFADWHSFFLYGKTLAWIGSAAFLFGLFGLIGSLGVTRSYRQNFYSEHQGSRTFWEHINLGMDEEERSVQFFWIAFLIGTPPFLAGWLLQLFL